MERNEKGQFVKGCKPIAGFKKGFKHTEEWKQWISEKMKVRIFTETHRKKISESKKGEKNWMFGKKGELNVNWRGGITPKNLKIRNSDEFQNWRKSVFERDNHTCQLCF